MTHGIRTNQPQLLLSYQWATTDRSHTACPYLLAAQRARTTFGQFWWLLSQAATHRRQGANVQHKRGGALLPNTREQGGESPPSLVVSTRNKPLASIVGQQEADQLPGGWVTMSR